MKKLLTSRGFFWMVSLILGLALGALKLGALDRFFNFVASAYTALFQFVAVPTIALAILVTLAELGEKKGMGRIFGHTVTYTLLTTIAAALVGLGLYCLIQPGNLPADIVSQGQAAVSSGSTANLTVQAQGYGFYSHILKAIPNNIVRPFAEGNVLSILIVAATLGLGLAAMPASENKSTVMRFLRGAQDLFFIVIRALIKALPPGIVAFAAQLSAQIATGVVVGSLGKYLAVVLIGNALQFFVVLPLFLVIRGINPFKTMKAMSQALMMALFTKSSAATLPVTIASAEGKMQASPRVARFVLPICCTINMNGCAAFILVTSIFVLQNGGMAMTLPTMLTWTGIAVLSAIGNAGVPMGCYFLTLSLMAGMQAPIGIMGIILPLYTVIDMIETAENVWSDSCVCAMVDKDLREHEEKVSIFK